MRIKLPRKRIAVTGNYRKDYYCYLLATQVGTAFYISKWQARKAERECRLPTGDYLVLGNDGLKNQGYGLWVDGE